MSDWRLVYDAWAPERQPLREALCALGNGFMCVRGAAEECDAGGVHYPGTYLAGGYDRLTTEISGRGIENEDLVNWPNFLRITFRPEDGQWLCLADADVLDFEQDLDLRRGVLTRRLRIRDADGRTSVVHARRFVSMARPHVAAIRWSLTAEDWSGPVIVRSEIDGEVTNAGVERYRELRGHHIDVESTDRPSDDVVRLVCRSVQSRLRVAIAARHRLETPDRAADGAAEHDGPAARRSLVDEPARVGQAWSLPIREGETVSLEKVCVVHSHRDHAISEPAHDAARTARLVGGFEQLVHEHESAWERLWEHADIELEADEFTRRTLRLHVFHLLQTASPNSIHGDAGVPARGWHGEAYRGHVFWDELFIMPFLTLRVPEISRALLMYRFRRLEEARRNAAEAGHAGAMYPWQSGSNGREESQTLHLNPRSGNWVPDETHRQRHINAAIAWNVWHYHQATLDEEFLSFYGAEMILEIARFWASMASWNDERERYDIVRVVGPDEYHTDDPNWEGSGLRNNAYTNVMAAWTIRCAERVLGLLPHDRADRLRRDLGIDDAELERWRDVRTRLHVPISDGIIEQFEGYEDLEEFDWDGYRERYDDIQRLDRILEAEGDSPNRYKASKQADVLMLFYLFSAEQLVELLGEMGIEFDPEWIPRNIAYYEDRTSHGSTLSRVVSAWVTARSHRGDSWDLFDGALRSDVEDIQGGTTSEGIHLGAMAGTVDLVQRCYAGLELRDDTLWLDPALPEELREIRFRLRYRGHTLGVRVNHEEMVVSSCRDGPRPISVGIHGAVEPLHEGQTRRERIGGELVA